MDAIASFFKSRKGIVYLVTVVVAVLVYMQGDITGEMLLTIVGGGGAVFQFTTAWEDSVAKANPPGALELDLAVKTEAGSEPSAEGAA